VARLRDRKQREGKPFAVMAGSVAAARRLARFDEAGLAALVSQERPTVLAPLAAGYDLADGVAPRLDQVGVMLPYAPLHHLLLGVDQVVVATSANLSGRPLTYRNDDARRDLGSIVDAFLMHDRGIHVPVEDSVVAVDDGAVHPVRRSRGYAPLPVRLGESDRCVLAVGAELKNTFALTRDGLAFMSAHIGDMGTLETQHAFEASVAQQEAAHRRTPELIVVDKHPGYSTRAWGMRAAERLGLPVVEVQHHHAHALALLAEQGRIGQPLTCAVFDGTGYGDDATIWGGEILALDADPLDYDRRWHLPGFWLPGGDSAVRHPWKQAVALLRELGRDPRAVPALAGAVEARVIDPAEWALAESQIDHRVALVFTTSAGRLFDAVAALLGVCQTATYEAQAAMELEAVASTWRGPVPDTAGDGADLAGLVARLLDGVSQGQPVALSARLFHDGLAKITADALLASNPAIPVVGLTGGVFANRLLTRAVSSRLREAGYGVLIHQMVPANDGGLALGQALAGYLTMEGR
jgi:hydrogenase maturation protein HypF